MTDVRRGDVVVDLWMAPAVRGVVQRTARNGAWADVLWRGPGADWTKRMKTAGLTLLTRGRGTVCNCCKGFGTVSLTIGIVPCVACGGRA
jgi:hypothetical protein